MKIETTYLDIVRLLGGVHNLNGGGAGPTGVGVLQHCVILLRDLQIIYLP